MKPKTSLVWPAAIEPCQPTSEAVTEPPDWDSSVFQWLWTVWFPGQVHVSVQPERAVSAVTDTFPCQPEPHSLATVISALHSPSGGSVVGSSGSVVGSSGSVVGSPGPSSKTVARSAVLTMPYWLLKTLSPQAVIWFGSKFSTWSRFSAPPLLPE